MNSCGRSHTVDGACLTAKVADSLDVGYFYPQVAFEYLAGCFNLKFSYIDAHVGGDELY